MSKAAEALGRGLNSLDCAADALSSKKFCESVGVKPRAGTWLLPVPSIRKCFNNSSPNVHSDKNKLRERTINEVISTIRREFVVADLNSMLQRSAIYREKREGSYVSNDATVKELLRQRIFVSVAAVNSSRKETMQGRWSVANCSHTHSSNTVFLYSVSHWRKICCAL